MDRRIGVGIIGAGGVSSTHIAGLLSHCHDLARIVAVADVNAERGQRAAHAAHGADYHSSYAELLTRDDIAFVDVLTPPATHFQVGMDALTAGKHVSIIKPFTVELRDADALIAAAGRQGVKLFAGHPQRYDPGTKLIMEAVARGDLGEPVRLYARNFLHPTSLQKSENWYYDLRKSGGLTIETLVHTMDLMAWLFGPAVRAYAEADSYYTRRSDDQLPDDQVAVLYRFANRALGIVEGASVRALGAASFLLEVSGTEGTAWRDPQLPGVVHLSQTKATSGRIETQINAGPVGGVPQMLRAFLECVRDDTPVPITGTDGRYAVELAWAATQSYQLGRPVSLPFDVSAYPSHR